MQILNGNKLYRVISQYKNVLTVRPVNGILGEITPSNTYDSVQLETLGYIVQPEMAGAK